MKYRTKIVTDNRLYIKKKKQGTQNDKRSNKYYNSILEYKIKRENNDI